MSSKKEKLPYVMNMLRHRLIFEEEKLKAYEEEAFKGHKESPEPKKGPRRIKELKQAIEILELL